MDDELKERFFNTMMCFRKLEAAFSIECEMQMNEMAILHNITGNCSCQECTCMNLDVPKMQEKLQISKPAVSYILNALEKKNYTVREIDPKDRRKITISTTPEGEAAAERSLERYDAVWSDILTRFGEDNMRQLLDLLTDLNELYASMDPKKKCSK